MQKAEHQQPPSSSPPDLTQFLKLQPSHPQQHKILQSLLLFLIWHKANPQAPSSPILQPFTQLYLSLSKQIKQTLLYKYVSYRIWNDEGLPVGVREKTEFFRLVSEWIICYQMRAGELGDLRKQVEFLGEFVGKETKDVFQRVVLLDQIHEDLVELLGRKFWGLQPLQQQKQKQKQSIVQATKQQAGELLKLLSQLVDYQTIPSPTPPKTLLQNTPLHLLTPKTKNYHTFISRSLLHILSVNSSKKSPSLCLQNHQEMELTRIALIFLQRSDLVAGEAVELLRLLMLRTSRLVRYAMVVDYVRFYDFLEKADMYGVLEQLENMVYFRELIIGQAQIDQAGLLPTQPHKPLSTLLIPARTKHRLLLSHQPLYGTFSIFQLQFLIQGGDLTISIYSTKDNKETLYWKQERTEDRRVDILVKEEGLYVVELDNCFSWLKGKRVSYRIEQYCQGGMGMGKGQGKE